MKNLCVLVALILVSCSQEKSHLEKLLTHNKWGYYDNSKFNPNSIFTTYMLFENDGKCIDYVFDSGKKYNNGEWSYNSNESILKIHNIEFKVLGIEKDTIRLYRTERKYGAMLINVNTLKQ